MRMLLACPAAETPAGPVPDTGGVPPEVARVARGLRDAGHEVVLVGGLDPVAVVPVAVQEDVEVVAWLGHPPEVAGDEAVTVLADPDATALLQRVAAHAVRERAARG